MFKILTATLTCVLFTAAIASAQTTQNSSGKLAFLIPDLFGPDGLLLPNPNHEAHFPNPEPHDVKCEAQSRAKEALPATKET